jgi:NAD(P)-dependent dehydrogenase (short-subunit alcohol dehydrogenase family)
MEDGDGLDGSWQVQAATAVSAPDLFRLDGVVALVIGGAGGLGRSMARGLAEAGAAVAVADVDAGAAGEVAAAIGPIGVLVNSAGITRRGAAADFAPADWDRIIAVNLTGVFTACQVVGRRMLERSTGSIVNIASIAGHIGLPGTIAYTASKGGVVMLTRGLAVEWASRGVRVNAIAPSWFETSLGGLVHREPEYEARAMRRVPMGRMGQPDELVGTVVYLASEASRMVTGHVLAVDGGTLAS